MAAKTKMPDLVPMEWLLLTNLRSLVLLFKQHAAFFKKYLDVTSLTLPFQDYAEGVYRAITFEGSTMPADLLKALTQITQLSTERAQAAFLELKAAEELDLGADQVRLGMNDLAILFYVHHPKLFERVFVFLATEKGEAYEEFSDPSRCSLERHLTKKTRAELEAKIAAHCEARNCTAYINTQIIREGDELIFYIARGAPARALQSVDPKTLQAGVTRLIPTHHDKVIYNTREHRISIRCHTAADLRFYVAVLGEVFLGNASQFQKTDRYTCDPLLRDCPTAMKPVGKTMTRAMLKEITVENPEKPRWLKAHWYSHDLTHALGRYLSYPDFKAMTSSERAVLAFEFSDFEGEVTATIRPDRITVKPRSRTEDVRRFFRANGYVVSVIPAFTKAA